MSEPWRERVEVGDAVLYLGGARDVLPTLGQVECGRDRSAVSRLGCRFGTPWDTRWRLLKWLWPFNLLNPKQLSAAQRFFVHVQAC